MIILNQSPKQNNCLFTYDNYENEHALACACMHARVHKCTYVWASSSSLDIVDSQLQFRTAHSESIGLEKKLHLYGALELVQYIWENQ